MHYLDDWGRKQIQKTFLHIQERMNMEKNKVCKMGLFWHLPSLQKTPILFYGPFYFGEVYKNRSQSSRTTIYQSLIAFNRFHDMDFNATL